MNQSVHYNLNDTWINEIVFLSIHILLYHEAFAMNFPIQYL